MKLIIEDNVYGLYGASLIIQKQELNLVKSIEIILK